MSISSDVLGPSELQARQAPLETDPSGTGSVRELFAQWNALGLRYCHWKSNHHLEHALAAEEDLDLLFAREDFPLAVRMLLQRGFKLAETPTSRQQPGVHHLLGADEELERLVNVHAYTRILTGDHLLKSYSWPFAPLLLGALRVVHGVSVPEKSAELVVHVVRSLVKHTTLVDHYFLSRSGDPRPELTWLLDGADLGRCGELLAEHLPEIRFADFQRALALLEARGPLAHARRVALGMRWRRALAKYSRFGTARRVALTSLAALRLGWNKLVRRRRPMSLQDGGLVVALVGPQATGKSTIIAHLARWLGQELAVRVTHVGKPPTTWITFVPTRLVPLARRLLAHQTSARVEVELENDARTELPLVFLVRRVMLAYDRRVLLRRAYRESRNGCIVLCDRYPADNVGAVDGPTFDDERIASEKVRWKRVLMRLERRLYATIPPPDLVLQLSAPVDVAVLRNRIRKKTGDQSEDYVRFRHGMSRRPVFRRAPVVEISSDRELEETLAEVRRALWQRL